MPLTATFRALRHPALLTLGLAALFYNFGFFSLLAYTPVPAGGAAQAAGYADFGAHQLGSDLLWLGPRAGAHLGLRRARADPSLRSAAALYAMLLLLAVDLVAMARRRMSAISWVLIIAHRVGGLFLGVMNTVLTESVMEATELPRSVASSTYSGIRFVGGAIAPALAGVIAARSPAVPVLASAPRRSSSRSGSCSSAGATWPRSTSRATTSRRCRTRPC